MGTINSVPQAVTKIKRQFGDEYDVVITTDDIYGWIYEAELDIIRNTGCNDTRITVATSSFPFEVPVAVNFKRLSISGKALQYTTKAELDLLGLSTTTTGGTQYWYREGISVYLWPVEDSTKLVEILYTKVPELMEDPSMPDPPLSLLPMFTVPDVYIEDIVNYCIGRAHNKNNNLQAEQVQMALYDKSLPNRRDEAQSADAVLYKGADPMDFEEVS